MRFEIKHRWNGSVLFAIETTSIKLAVEAAVRAKANLSAADLSAANLRAANLSAANLSDANLSDADLSAANLSAANLRDANLSDANLSAANLRAADLSAANLRAANLSAANLSAADLSAADLRAANLSAANLSAADLSATDLSAANLRAANLRVIRDDLWAVLSSAPREVPGLRKALVEGRIDGSAYTGECVCLVGTIANVRGTNIESLGCLAADSGRPAERWFLSIRPGDAPDKSAVAKVALEWIDEWAVNVGAAARELLTSTK